MSSTVYEKKDSVLNVAPEGRLDTATAPVLEQELRERMDGVQNIVMDFARVEYVSSGGLRMLLAIEQTLEEKGGRLSLLQHRSRLARPEAEESGGAALTVVVVAAAVYTLVPLRVQAF